MKNSKFGEEGMGLEESIIKQAVSSSLKTATLQMCNNFRREYKLEDKKITLVWDTKTA